MWKPLSGLTARLTLLILVMSLCAAMVVSVVTYRKAREALEASIYSRLETVVTLKESELRRWVKDREKDLLTFSRDRYLLGDLRVMKSTGFKPDQAYTAYWNLSHSVRNFAAGDMDIREALLLSVPDGREFVSSSRGHEGAYRINDSYFVKGQEGTYIQNVYPWPVTTLPTISMSTPLSAEDGRILAVLAIHLDLDNLDRIILAKAGLGSSGETYLVDRFNSFVSARRFGREEFPRGVHSRGIDAAVAGEDGKGLYANYWGTPVVGVYRWLDDLELAMVAEMSQEEAFQPARQLAVYLSVTGVILALVLTVIIFLVSRSIVSPIVRVSQAARQVADGNLAVKAPVMSDDEVGMLARSFNDMTEKVSSLYSALQKSEEHFRTVFRVSPDAITVCRMDNGAYVNVSEGYYDVTGYTPEEITGKTGLDIDIWVDVGVRERAFEGLRNEGRLRNFEVQFRRKDGTIFDALLSAATIDLDGEEHLISMIRDVTELNKAQAQVRSSLAEKEILLQEIHHRVKNNLQVISGLLNLQAHHIHDDKGREVYKESQNRVITMALIHEELYQAKDLSRVDFGDYIKNLTGNLFGSYATDNGSIDLELDMEQAELVVDTAIPCGLIINELISNSLKHAFPYGRPGKVKVEFSRRADDMFLLTVCDDGIGIPDDLDIDRSASLGLKLVTVLSEQLGAELDISTEGGTCFTLTFAEYHEAGTTMY
jgi:PAS domain S-box-containing protein